MLENVNLVRIQFGDDGKSLRLEFIDTSRGAPAGTLECIGVARLDYRNTFGGDEGFACFIGQVTCEQWTGGFRLDKKDAGAFGFCGPDGKLQSLPAGLLLRIQIEGEASADILCTDYRLTSNDGVGTSQGHVKTALRLTELAWPGFVETDGAVLLADVHARNLRRDPEMDLTAWEAFANHVHTLDIFTHECLRYPETGDEILYDPEHSDFHAACELGKTFARMWFAKLRQDFPAYRFRVYYTQDDDPIVRFHRVREGEPFWLMESDWREDVAARRVVVLDTIGQGP